MRVNLTIVNRSPNMKMLTAATIATFFLTGSSAQESEQKCYACGPEAQQWYPTMELPSCDNFTENEQFSVDCGNDYNYCGITTNSKSNIISRICSKNLTENCAVENEGDDLNILCTCNSTLCNGDALGKELSKSFSMTTAENNDKEPQTVESEAKSKNVSDDIPEELPETTTQTDVMMNDDANVPQKPLILNGDNKPNNSNIHIMTQESSQDTVTSHSLPSPAALGHDSISPSQGPPVDDEEDSLEGSGSNPTSTAGTTPDIPTTTLNPENGASSIQGSKIILTSIVWTIGITYLMN